MTSFSKGALRSAVACATAAMAMSASAGYFEIGAEIEDYNGVHGDGDFYLPYVTVGGNPIEGSSFTAELKTSQRIMDASDARASSNRYRNDITIGYTFQHGDFTFNPRYRQRQNFYANSRDYEHRFFPNMSYRLNDTFSLQLDGFVAPVHKKRQSARGTDSADQLHDYVDYKHEFDMRLNTQLSETQRLTVSVYNEYSRTTELSKSAANDGDTTRNANEWQLRVVYSQNFGDFTLTPFARFGLSKTAQKVEGYKLDENRHRFGIAGSYKLSSDLTLVGETYFQTQNQESWNGTNTVSDSDKNMMFYKVGVRYSF